MANNKKTGMNPHSGSCTFQKNIILFYRGRTIASAAIAQPLAVTGSLALLLAVAWSQSFATGFADSLTVTGSLAFSRANAVVMVAYAVTIGIHKSGTGCLGLLYRILVSFNS